PPEPGRAPKPCRARGQDAAITIFSWDLPGKAKRGSAPPGPVSQGMPAHTIGGRALAGRLPLSRIEGESLPRRRPGEKPDPQGREGEGRTGGDTLTRLAVARHPLPRCGRGVSTPSSPR